MTALKTPVELFIQSWEMSSKKDDDDKIQESVNQNIDLGRNETLKLFLSMRTRPQDITSVKIVTNVYTLSVVVQERTV